MKAAARSRRDRIRAQLADLGSCKEMASAILSEARKVRARFEPVRYQPNVA